MRSDRGVVVARCFANPRNKLVPMRVMNVTSKEVKLHSGAVADAFEASEEVSALESTEDERSSTRREEVQKLDTTANHTEVPRNLKELWRESSELIIDSQKSALTSALTSQLPNRVCNLQMQSGMNFHR